MQHVHFLTSLSACKIESSTEWFKAFKVKIALIFFRHWEHVFQVLSELDGERVEKGGRDTINIKKLKQYIRQQKSYEVRVIKWTL